MSANKNISFIETCYCLAYGLVIYCRLLCSPLKSILQHVSTAWHLKAHKYCNPCGQCRVCQWSFLEARLPASKTSPDSASSLFFGLHLFCANLLSYLRRSATYKIRLAPLLFRSLEQRTISAQNPRAGFLTCSPSVLKESCPAQAMSIHSYRRPKITTCQTNATARHSSTSCITLLPCLYLQPRALYTQEL